MQDWPGLMGTAGLEGSWGTGRELGLEVGRHCSARGWCEVGLLSTQAGQDFDYFDNLALLCRTNFIFSY